MLGAWSRTAHVFGIQSLVPGRRPKAVPHLHHCNPSTGLLSPALSCQHQGSGQQPLAGLSCPGHSSRASVLFCPTDARPRTTATGKAALCPGPRRRKEDCFVIMSEQRQRKQCPNAEKGHRAFPVGDTSYCCDFTNGSVSFIPCLPPSR